MSPQRIGPILLALVFAALAMNALVQALLPLFGLSDDPRALTALQAIVGATGLAAAWASWAERDWSPAAAVTHGATTALMIVLLDPLLDLGDDARGGLWAGAALMLGLGLAAAWYLRRLRARRPAATTRAGR